MAKICNINEFIREYNGKIEQEKLNKILSLNEGEKDVLSVDNVSVNDLIFIRVTKHHIALMTVPEYNGFF